MGTIKPNLKKRSYLLPPGCKDLIDVLQPMKARRETSGSLSNEAGTISEIPKHIQRFVKSGRVLLIQTDEEVGFSLMRLLPEVISASIDFAEDAAREALVTSWCTRSGLDAPKKTERSVQFPEATVWIRFPVKPLPSNTRHLSELVISGFREVWNAGDETTLRFWHYNAD
jgi:hypothetical protein